MMNTDYLLYLLIPFSFVLGSIPFGIIFTRNSGVDIRSTGSRNIGATNVLRSAGKVPALLTLACDVLKGAAPVLICLLVIIKLTRSGDYQGHQTAMMDIWPGIAGLSAVMGHMFSVFLSFKGGKGVATGFGVMLVYSPAVALIMLFIWLAAALITKYSALAAICAVSAMPVLLVLFKASSFKIAVGIIISALIIYKHKSNIKNLMSGTEDKIGTK
jgi:glycerol-3-phosphate acyltransferase PlsY